MSDYRGRLIDTAARALHDVKCSTDKGVSDMALAEAVIDALGIIALHGNSGFPVFRIACLEAPAIQTHDYSAEHETRHGL